MVDHAATQVRQRIKYMMGYPEAPKRTSDKTMEADQLDPLLEIDHYGLGTERSREEYYQFAEVNVVEKTCGPMKWCTEGSLE